MKVIQQLIVTFMKKTENRPKDITCVTKVFKIRSPIFDHSIEFTIIICYSFSLIEKIFSLTNIMFNIINEL